MDPTGDLRVNNQLVIPASELQWRYSTSGGPGGQHANTSQTRAEVTFDIGASSVLGSQQRQRLQDRFGLRVTVGADDTRSQLRNRQLAAQRLADRLRAALVVEAERVPTRRTRGANERRLADKRRRAQRKTFRSDRSRHDD